MKTMTDLEILNAAINSRRKILIDRYIEARTEHKQKDIEYQLQVLDTYQKNHLPDWLRGTEQKGNK